MNESGAMVEWNWRWNTELQEGNLSHCDSVRHKSHMVWPGIERGRARWKTGDCLGHDTTTVGRTVLVRLPACTDSSLQSITGSDDHPASHPNGPRSPAVKGTERESDHSPIHLVQRLRIRGAVPLNHLACCFTKHKENFPFMCYNLMSCFVQPCVNPGATTP
jgi:hypothetical protein